MVKKHYIGEKVFRSLQAILLTCWLLCGLMLTSCGTATQPASHRSPATTPTPTSPATPASVINMPVPTTGCGKPSPVTPGSSANQAIASHPDVSRGNSTRTYIVHIPATYKANQPEAAVLVFHGHGGSAADTDANSGFSELAEQRGFIAVSPQGLPDNDHLPFWASIGPIDYGINDALFVSDMLTKLQTDFCVDPQRIYATGFSN